MASMNVLDVVILMILSYCVIRGVFRGLVRELAAIAGVLAGCYTAYVYHAQVGRWLSRWNVPAAYQSVLGFALIFLGVLLAFSLAGIALKRLMQVTLFGWMDRICGGCLGALKGILISAVLLITLTAFLPANASAIRQSRLAPHVSGLSETLTRAASSQMGKDFMVKIREIKKSWHNNS